MKKRFTLYGQIFRFLLLLALVPNLLGQDNKLLTIGDLLPPISYTDQFDKEAPIPVGTEKVLFVGDMDASKITHPILLKEGDDYLLKYKSVIVSDINRMPSLISKFVALPKMREYPYTLRLIREAKVGDPYPRTKGMVTCIELKAEKIVKIDFYDNELAVRNFLESTAKNKLQNKEIKQ